MSGEFYAIDVGNSSIKVAYIRNWRIAETIRRPATTKMIRLQRRLPAIVCSVTEGRINVIGAHPALYADNDLRVPIASSYNRRQLGADRLVNSYCASECGYAPAIVVSIGTALTIDFVNKFGRHEGGVITSSPQLSLAALNDYCDRLPLAEATCPPSRLGRDRQGRVPRLRQRNTVPAMQAGTYYLYSSMLRALKKQHPQYMIVGTGGGAGMYKAFFDAFIPNLTIRGLIKLAQYHARKIFCAA